MNRRQRVRRNAGAVAQNPLTPPATVFDAVTRKTIETSPADGCLAVAALAACAATGTAGHAVPAFSATQPNSPATLHLMSLVAQAESYPQCVPV
jgi:endoglucanase